MADRIPATRNAPNATPPATSAERVVTEARNVSAATTASESQTSATAPAKSTAGSGSKRIAV